MKSMFKDKPKTKPSKNAKQETITKKQLIEILAVCMIMGIALLIYDYYMGQVAFDGNLKRGAAGEGTVSEDLELDFLDETRDYTVEISDRSLTRKKLEEKFTLAIEEINATYLSENESANYVTSNLSLKQTYVDGLISAHFKFDKYGVISSDGKLNYDEISDDGDVVNIIAELSYEDETELYSFSVAVYKPGMDTLEGQLLAIDNAVENADKESRTSPSLSLPKQVDNLSLVWKKKMDYRGLQIMMLGIAAVLGISLGKRKDDSKARKEIIAQKEQDYPMIVSELSILLSAGMSFRKALERIVLKYNQKKSKGVTRAGYEDMVHTYRKMVDGMGEISALEDLGQTSGSKEYRKLSMLLIQNLKKGSRDLIDSLEKEERNAFEMRKQRAIKAGEEASTKLLIPMTGMLFIVIVILIVPALLQINI